MSCVTDSAGDSGGCMQSVRVVRFGFSSGLRARALGGVAANGGG